MCYTHVFPVEAVIIPKLWKLNIYFFLSCYYFKAVEAENLNIKYKLLKLVCVRLYACCVFVCVSICT